MTLKGLDRWITGNWGEDHPANQPEDDSDGYVVIVENPETGKPEAKTIIPPDELFSFWTPDEVAECLSVSDALYAKLWALVDEYKAPKNPEYPEEKWVDRLNRWWSHFTDEEKRELNRAAREER